jgi:hypothetical protein
MRKLAKQSALEIKQQILAAVTSRQSTRRVFLASLRPVTNQPDSLSTSDSGFAAGEASPW